MLVCLAREMESQRNISTERVISIESADSMTFEAKLDECLTTVLKRFRVQKTILNDLSCMCGLAIHEVRYQE